MGLFDIFRRRKPEPGPFEVEPSQPHPEVESKSWTFPGGSAVSYTVTSGGEQLIDTTSHPELRDEISAALRAAGIDPGNPGAVPQALDPAAAGQLMEAIQDTLRQAGHPIPELAALPGESLTSVPPPTGDLVDDLVRLAQLKASGALTDAEFETAKAKLLGGGSLPPPTA